MDISEEKRKTALLSSLILVFAITAEAAPSSFEESGRHLVPDRWWQTAAAIKLVTLKKGRSFAHEISIEPVKASEELDRIKAEGFQAIEIFAAAKITLCLMLRRRRTILRINIRPKPYLNRTRADQTRLAARPIVPAKDSRKSKASRFKTKRQGRH